MKRSDYKIVRDAVDGTDVFDVYIKSCGRWVIVETFLFKENAEKYIENDMKEGK